MPASRNSRLLPGWLLAIAALCAAVLASLWFGSGDVPPGRVWDVLWHPDDSTEAGIVRGLRWPRTVVALLVGAGLGVAGALMQSLTRNPLADPGILGINAGASLAVVGTVATFGMMSIQGYLWVAFVGAGLAAVAVSVLGASGRADASPARLALAGIAVSAAVSAAVQVVILLDQQTFNEFRFWVAGSLEGRGMEVAGTVGIFIGAGVLLALWLAPSLNALSLGEQMGAALGVNLRRTRAWTMVAVTLLCGAATAAVGPIGFVGLGVPFIARFIAGTDQRRVVPLCLVLGPTMVLAADVLARLVIAPQEVQVGIITALLGGPLFIAIVRRPRIEAV